MLGKTKRPATALSIRPKASHAPPQTMFYMILERNTTKPEPELILRHGMHFRIYSL